MPSKSSSAVPGLTAPASSAVPQPVQQQVASSPVQQQVVSAPVQQQVVSAPLQQSAFRAPHLPLAISPEDYASMGDYWNEYYRIRR